jgi:hypothetical protein
VFLLVAMAFLAGFGHGYKRDKALKAKMDGVLSRVNGAFPFAETLERWLGYPQ